MKKKIFIMQNEFFFFFYAGTVFGLLPKLYCEAEIFCIATLVLYCKRGLEKKNCSENCIAIQFLYCREEGLSSLNCIA